jgi:hypothetical protein
MAAQNNAQTIALQLEKVRDKVPLLYERDDVLLSMIQQRGDIEKVSSRNMRLPLQLVPGGKAGSYSADGGDLGRGSGTTYDVAQVSPIFFRFAVEITKLVEYASNAREKAIENAVKREIASGMKQFRGLCWAPSARSTARRSQWPCPRARRSCTWARRSKSTIPHSPPTATSRPASFPA